MTLSDFGSFEAEIKLPRKRWECIGSPRGAEDERLTGNCNFQVQQYRPNAFEITIPPPPAVTGPAQLDLAIAAKYFMGTPLLKAKFTWSLVARDDAFKPDGFEISPSAIRSRIFA